ncbi:MAG TPA: DUF4159 domain-containing protein [Phycisphaerae bacterium]|nr:DUF4159 domain-containing protein [Phycisphaerae bacterium]
MLALHLFVAVAIGAAPAAATEPAPKLDLRKVKLTSENGQLAGEITYTLVVGSFYEWNTDPTAIPGLFSEVANRTKLKPRVDFATVSLDGQDLFVNPLLIMTGNRLFILSDDEIANLRRYVLAGGFIYADDCGGADWSFRHMMSKILPEHKLEEVPGDHPVRKQPYDLPAIPKIIDLYRTEAKAFGIFIDGRLAVFYTYDTDIPCGWEKHADGSFVHLLTPEKHEQSFRFGTNMIVYALGELQKLSAGKEAEAPADGAK